MTYRSEIWHVGGAGECLVAQHRPGPHFQLKTLNACMQEIVCHTNIVLYTMSLLHYYPTRPAICQDMMIRECSCSWACHSSKTALLMMHEVKGYTNSVTLWRTDVPQQVRVGSA